MLRSHSKLYSYPIWSAWVPYTEKLTLESSKKINNNYSNELDFVISFYKDDISPCSLKTQLELLSTSFSETDYQPSITGLRGSLSPQVCTNLSEVCTLLKIVTIIPATNAVSERSASAVCKIKTYLRSTITQVQFNNLILHIHEEKTDNLDLATCLNEIYCWKWHRLSCLVSTRYFFIKFCTF